MPALKGPALVNAIVEQWMNTDITVEGTQASPQITTTLNKDVVKGPKLEGKFCLQVFDGIVCGTFLSLAVRGKIYLLYGSTYLFCTPT